MSNTRRIILVLLITVVVSVTSVVVQKWILGRSAVWFGGAISGAVGGIVMALFHKERKNPGER